MKSFLLLLCAGLPLSASIIFDNADSPQFTTLRNGQGIAAYLQIGASNVTINQIAINAAPAVSGQLQFLIFSDVAYPGNDAGSVLLSDTVNAAPSSALAYVLSDSLSFTLQAGHYYDIGAIFNGGNITFAYDLLGNTMGGITSIARNENIGQFANPILLGHALGDAQIQLYSTATIVPEPSALALLALTLLAFAFHRASTSTLTDSSSETYRTESHLPRAAGS